MTRGRTGTKSAAAEADFLQVMAFLTERYKLRLAETEKNFARQLHASVYSTIIWRFHLRCPDHGRVFLDESASDALQILPHALLGFKKSTVLLTRNLIENIVRHLYFIDHPVEFQRVNRDKKWYLATQDLFDYLRTHHVYLDSEKKFNAIGKLKDLYSELSAGVHGARLSNMHLYKALDEIKPDGVFLQEHAKTLKRTVEACNFLLVIFHKEQLDRIPTNLRHLIMMSIRAPGRKVAQGLL